MRRFLFLFIVLIYTSCDKNKELQTYSESYHIVNGDTLSYIFVPNTFTPNGDGINDFFFPICNGIPNGNYNLKIYNLGGEVIFETSHPDQDWDGSNRGYDCENGNYKWKIWAKDHFEYEYDLEGEIHLLK